jgi:methylmalonyl-CoA mutase
MKQKGLFDEFPPVSTKEWMDKISADLKGADFNKRLVWKTNEGFSVMPFYRLEDLESLNHIDRFLPLLLKGDVATECRDGGIQKNPDRRINNSWLVRQDLTVTDYSSSNKKALSILSKGVDSLGFVIADPESITESNFTALLKGINPGCTEINFLSGGKAREIISLLQKIAEKKGFDKSLLRGAVEADPLGRLMINGTLCIPVEAGFDYLASLFRDALYLAHYRCLQINGSNFANTGSDAVQELAFSFSMAVEYLAQLTERGIKADETSKKIRFSFGTGSNYFMEIAKLRAARILWSLIAEAYNPADSNSFRMEMHCVTSKWNTTVYDPYVNMLRTQTEAMSAVLGGTDSLTVNPFDIAFRNPGEFSERIARNQQLILKNEAHFDKVADPASGSYYIEKLTALIAEASWKQFLEIEDAGGFLPALMSGLIQNKLDESAAKRKSDISKRKEILLGTNLFPNPEERFNVSEYCLSESEEVNTSDLILKPVEFSRGSEEFEKIRIAVDNASRRPVVFLLAIGNHVMRRARAQFSAGFFGCAGYKIIDTEGYDTVDEGIEAALKTEADIVVICSSDEEYPIYASVIMARFRGKSIVVIAGNPPNIDRLKSQGLENFISMRSDILESLKYFNSCLGIGN